MKNFKLLFTVLLLSVFTAQSQVKPYVINQQLQLKTVPLGAASDSVMVVGPTGLVKHVPKSSIGGGGSQDLQQVLDNNGTAFYDGYNSMINLLYGDENFRASNIVIGNGIISSSMLLANNQASLTNTSSDRQGAFIVTDGKPQIYSTVNEEGQTSVNFLDPIGATQINFPAKSTGIYTIATLDDIAGLATKEDIKTVLHTEIATSTGVVSSVGANWTGTGTALNTNYIGGQVFIEGVGVAIIATLDEGAQTFTTLQPLLSDVTDSAFELRTIAYKLYDNGDQKWFDAHEGSPRITLNADGNFFANSFSALANGASNVGLLTNGNSEFWGDKVTSPLLINKVVYTVATLPTPDSGERAYASVSDALAPTYLGVLVGGGTINCPVYWNGTAWISH